MFSMNFSPWRVTRDSVLCNGQNTRDLLLAAYSNPAQPTVYLCETGFVPHPIGFAGSFPREQDWTDLGSKWVRLTENGTNPVLFQITYLRGKMC